MTLSTALTRRVNRDGQGLVERRGTAAPAVAVLGMFVVTLDATIVNVALPSIRGGLGGGISGQQWIVDGYTLMFAALLLSSGALSDRIGAKRAFGAGLVIFTAASVACGAAPTLGSLVAARFLQGAGAAVMMPSSMALIRHAYADPILRARALAMWSVGGAVAAAAGPFFGGLLSLASWRLIFFVNLPVGLIALILLARTRRSPHHEAPFDVPGQFTALVAMGALTFGAIEAGSQGFAAPSVIAALATALAASVAFVTLQLRAAHPMVPPALFRSRGVTMSIVVGFAFMVGFYGAPFLFSLYLQQVRNLSPLATGLAFLPMALIGVVLTPLAPRLVERVGPRPPVVAGLTLMVTGLISLAVLTAERPPTWAVGSLLVLVGVVGPLVMPPTTAVLMQSVPARLAGTASGVFNTSRQLGGALAVAVFGAVVAGPAGLVDGVPVSLLIAAAVGAIAVAAVWWGMGTPKTENWEGH